MQRVLHYVWRSPFGWMGLASNARGMVAITSPRSSRLEAMRELERCVRVDTFPGENRHIRRSLRELGRYFRDGKRADFRRISLDPRIGTRFERRVWGLLRRIPFGETRTYGELARAVGRPLAARAVGQCNARNPWAIVVPCHRVLGTNLSLTGYAGGIELKQRLLKLEGIDLTALRAKVLAAVPERKRGHAHRD